MRRISRTGYIALGTAAVIVVGGGMAFAFWTANGSGTGTADVGTTASVAVTQTNAITGLYPGGPAQPIAIKVDNPNASAITLVKVVATVSGTTNAGCTAADFTISGNAYNGGTVPGNGSVNGTTATIAMNNSGLNQDACKGVTVNLAFTAS